PTARGEGLRRRRLLDRRLRVRALARARPGFRHRPRTVSERPRLDVAHARAPELGRLGGGHAGTSADARSVRRSVSGSASATARTTALARAAYASASPGWPVRRAKSAFSASARHWAGG